MHIVFASDQGFVRQLTVASGSAVWASRGGTEGLVVHVLDCGIEDESWKEYEAILKRLAVKGIVKVEVIRHIIDMNLFANFKTYTNGSKATWARLLIPTLLVDVDQCVYSDCDMLFVANPIEMLEPLKDSNIIIAGHHDPAAEVCDDIMWCRQKNLTFDVTKYICAGLIAMNLKIFRSENIVQKCLDFGDHYLDVPLVDQTILNQVCLGRIALLPDGWGLFTQECHTFAGRIKSIHFAGGWPWKKGTRNWHALCLSLSKKECSLWREFETRMLGLAPSVSTMPSLWRCLVAKIAIAAARVANCFGIKIGRYQTCVAAYDGHSTALARVEQELFGE